jgi:hypothetical protein
MIDGLVLHVVIAVLVTIAAAACVFWYLGGRVQKYSLLLVAVIVPAAVFAATVYLAVSI